MNIQVTTFLRRDLLRNILPLKTLHGYGQQTICHYAEEDGAAGALLLSPTPILPFDYGLYPNTDYVVLLVADGPSVAAALLDQLPAGERLVFKLHGELEQALVAQRFAVRRTTAYSSYTLASGTQLPRWNDVIVSDRLDGRCLALYEQQGHDRAEVAHLFAAGEAFSCTCYRDDLPVASCLAFRNFEQIWEVGGLFTLPSVRRKGFGRRLVETALHELAMRGLTPRYVIHEDNQPSCQLAQAVGLQRFVTTTHFLC
jgi:GNAT superfamily N-acetyltransferase